MRNGCIGGDDEVAAFHHGCGIQKSISPRVEIIAQKLYPHVRRQVGQLRFPLALMEADEADIGRLRNRMKLADGE